MTIAMIKRPMTTLYAVGLAAAITIASLATAGGPAAAAPTNILLPSSSCAVSENQPTCSSEYVDAGSDGKIKITATKISGGGSIRCQANSHGSNLGEVSTSNLDKSTTINVGRGRDVAVLGFSGNNSFGKCTIE
jgi:hypothetical protein